MDVKPGNKIELIVIHQEKREHPGLGAFSNLSHIFTAIKFALKKTSSLQKVFDAFEVSPVNGLCCLVFYFVISVR
jgi:hypothetical protein